MVSSNDTHLVFYEVKNLIKCFYSFWGYQKVTNVIFLSMYYAVCSVLVIYHTNPVDVSFQLPLTNTVV